MFVFPSHPLHRNAVSHELVQVELRSALLLLFDGCIYLLGDNKPTAAPDMTRVDLQYVDPLT